MANICDQTFGCLRYQIKMGEVPLWLNTSSVVDVD